MSAVVGHAEETLRLLGLPIATTEDHEAALVTAAAQVHATLALVEEQRTANLVAFLARSEDRMRTESQQQLHDVIAARLGLAPKEN